MLIRRVNGSKSNKENYYYRGNKALRYVAAIEYLLYQEKITK
jgi:hypothetical protein